MSPTSTAARVISWPSSTSAARSGSNIIALKWKSWRSMKPPVPNTGARKGDGLPSSSCTKRYTCATSKSNRRMKLAEKGPLVATDDHPPPLYHISLSLITSSSRWARFSGFPWLRFWPFLRNWASWGTVSGGIVDWACRWRVPSWLSWRNLWYIVTGSCRFLSSGRAWGWTLSLRVWMGTNCVDECVEGEIFWLDLP